MASMLVNDCDVAQTEPQFKTNCSLFGPMLIAILPTHPLPPLPPDKPLPLIFIRPRQQRAVGWLACLFDPRLAAFLS
jgi:hypothetical protein